MFGGLFDFNRDGETDAFEHALGVSIVISIGEDASTDDDSDDEDVNVEALEDELDELEDELSDLEDKLSDLEDKTGLIRRFHAMRKQLQSVQENAQEILKLNSKYDDPELERLAQEICSVATTLQKE